MMTKEGSTKIVNFITHRVGILMLGRNHKSHYSDYAVIFYSRIEILFLPMPFAIDSMMRLLISKSELF